MQTTFRQEYLQETLDPQGSLQPKPWNHFASILKNLEESLSYETTTDIKARSGGRAAERRRNYR